MKKILFIIGVIFLLGNHAIAQSPDKDFVIIGVGTGDANLSQVQQRYAKKSDICYIKENEVSPMKQITKAIKGLVIRDLHVYLSGKPGELVFNSVTVNSVNVGEFKEQIMKWKNSISGKVVIHSPGAFTSPSGIELKKQLEEISGLEFVMIK